MVRNGSIPLVGFYKSAVDIKTEKGNKSMKLITKEVEKLFDKYPLYSQDDKGDEAKVLVKFFNPYGSATWYVLEASEPDEDGDRELFVLATLFGDELEYGYMMLSDILNTRVNVFGHSMPLERDMYFKGTVADAKKEMRC